MATEVERLVVSMEARLTKFDKDMRKAVGIADKSARSIETRFNKMQGSISKSATLVSNRLAGGLAAGFVAREAARLADAYNLLDARLRLVTNSEKERISTMKSLVGVATESRSELENTVNLYVRLAQGSQQLGYSQEQLLTLTKALTQSIILSGSGAQEAAAAMQQFSQALASGKLQGDEFRSISENAPDILRRLEKQLGVTRGELRKMATEGRLTSDVLGNTMINAAQDIQNEFSKMPSTIGQAMTNLRTNFLVLIGAADDTTGASERLIAGINALSAALADPGLKQRAADMAKELRTIGQEARSAAGLILGAAAAFENWTLRANKAISEATGGVIPRAGAPSGPIPMGVPPISSSVAASTVTSAGTGASLPVEPGSGSGTKKKSDNLYGLNSLFREQVIEANEKALEDFNKKMEEAKQVTTDFLSTFVNGMMQGRNATEAASEALKSLSSQLMDKGLQMALNALFSSFTAGLAPTPAALPGGYTGLLPFGLSGFRQHGGPVSAGRSYVVGENGPEMFVPRASGAVVANGGATVVRLDLSPDVEARVVRQADERTRVQISRYDRQLPRRMPDLMTTAQMRRM